MERTGARSWCMGSWRDLRGATGENRRPVLVHRVLAGVYGGK